MLCAPMHHQVGTTGRTDCLFVGVSCSAFPRRALSGENTQKEEHVLVFKRRLSETYPPVNQHPGRYGLDALFRQKKSVIFRVYFNSKRKGPRNEQKYIINKHDKHLCYLLHAEMSPLRCSEMARWYPSNPPFDWSGTTAGGEGVQISLMAVASMAHGT